jgi:HPt (histidine-containing phosphotransfer) domain-containing protein
VAQLLHTNWFVNEELRQLQRDYLADVWQSVEQMRQHGRGLTEQGNFGSSFPALLFLAHQLKGSGGSLGFPGITQVARRIADELSHFLDDREMLRPTAAELSETLVSLSGELEREVTSAQQALM